MYPFSHLPRRLSQKIFADLCRSLPPPYDDTQEALDSRDTIAMAAVAALDPHDAAEAEFAVQVILAEAQARHSLEQANKFADDLKVSMQCRAQARSMMQQTQAGLRGLQRLQATRERPEMALRRHEAEAAARAAGVLAAVAARLAEQSDGVADDATTLPPSDGTAQFDAATQAAARGAGRSDPEPRDPAAHRGRRPQSSQPPKRRETQSDEWVTGLGPVMAERTLAELMRDMDSDVLTQAGHAADATAEAPVGDTARDALKPFGSDRIPLWLRSLDLRHMDQNQGQRIVKRYNETIAARPNVQQRRQSAYGM